MESRIPLGRVKRMAVEQAVESTAREEGGIQVSLGSALEQATANRAMTVGLTGMSIAVLTFSLIFLFDRSQSGVFDPILFRATLADLVLSIFLLSFSGAAFFWQMEALRQRSSQAARYERWAGRSFLLGIGLFLVAPSLILFTVRLPDVGTLALALWLVMVVLLYRLRPESL